VLGDIIVDARDVYLRDIARLDLARAPGGRFLPNHPEGVIHLMLAPGADWSEVASEIREAVARSGFDAESPMLDETSPGLHLRLTGEGLSGMSSDAFTMGTRPWLDALVGEAPKSSKSILRYAGVEEGGLDRFDLFLELESGRVEDLAAIEARWLRSSPPGFQGLRVLRGIESPASTRHELDLFDEDLESLAELEVGLLERVEALGGVHVVDVLASRSGAPELVIDYRRERLAELGLTVADVSKTVQEQLARFRGPGRDLTDLSDMPISPGSPVKLRVVARMQTTVGFARVVHIDGRRGLRVRLDADSADVLKDVERALQELIDELDLRASLEIRWRGAGEV
jgi:multidrug efflux pump subunit AcrB